MGELVMRAYQGDRHAALTLALHALNNIDDLGPKPTPAFPPALYHRDPRKLDPESQGTLASHRQEVTSVESENAGRLGALLSLIYTMRSSVDLDPQCTDTVRRVERWTRSKYPLLTDLAPTLPNDRLVVRGIETKATRDYHALPKEWR